MPNGAKSDSHLRDDSSAKAHVVALDEGAAIALTINDTELHRVTCRGALGLTAAAACGGGGQSGIRHGTAGLQMNTIALSISSSFFQLLAGRCRLRAEKLVRGDEDLHIVVEVSMGGATCGWWRSSGTLRVKQCGKAWQLMSVQVS
jgi:hypothetical protein